MYFYKILFPRINKLSLLFGIFCTFLLASNAFAQSTLLTYKEIIKALETTKFPVIDSTTKRKLNNKTDLINLLIESVRHRKVDGILTEEIEKRLRGKGATGELIVAINSHSLKPNAVNKFYFVYELGSDKIGLYPSGDTIYKGRHTLWKQSEDAWIEEFPNKEKKELGIIGRIILERDVGTLLEGAVATIIDNQIKTGFFEYFVPDKGGSRMHIRCRAKDSNTWYDLGKMEGIE